MYAPSRQEGNTPSSISHSVGGSSSTGAKLSERKDLGSVDARVGGSMNVLMKSSNVVRFGENLLNGPGQPDNGEES